MGLIEDRLLDAKRAGDAKKAARKDLSEKQTAFNISQDAFRRADQRHERACSNLFVAMRDAIDGGEIKPAVGSLMLFVYRRDVVTPDAPKAGVHNGNEFVSLPKGWKATPPEDVEEGDLYFSMNEMPMERHGSNYALGGWTAPARAG